MRPQTTDDYRGEFLAKLQPLLSSQGEPNERKNDGMVQALLCCAVTVELASRRIDPNLISAVANEVYGAFWDIVSKFDCDEEAAK